MRNLTNLEKTLQSLVAIPSVSGNIQAAQEVIDFTKQRLRSFPLHTHEFHDKEYPILFMSTKPTLKPQTLLTAHVDVVPADEELFRLKFDSKKLYGRGVWDMKFAIAGYIELIENLGKDLPFYDFGILLTSDEETRNKNVPFALAKKVTPQNVVLLDGSNNWQVEERAKGALTVKITAMGTSTHGSRPWAGKSASLLLLDVLQVVRQWFPDESPQSNTLNVSRINAGQAVNQLPSHAEAWLDMRFVSDKQSAIIFKKLLKLSNNTGMQLSIGANFSALEHDLTNPYLATFIDSSSRITGASKLGLTSQGASDAIHFAEANIPCIVSRPTGGGHHGNNEWIDRASLQQMVPLLTEYLQSLQSNSL